MVFRFCPHSGDGCETGEPYIFFFDRNLRTSPERPVAMQDPNFNLDRFYSQSRYSSRVPKILFYGFLAVLATISIVIYFNPGPLITGIETRLENSAVKKVEAANERAQASGVTFNDAQSSEVDKSIIVVLCEHAVKESLTTPATADFPWTISKGIHSTGTRHVLSSYVDHDNLYGATVRTKFTCVVEGQGSEFSGYKLVDLTL